MIRLPWAFILCLPLAGAPVSGRVTDGLRPLAGVRVHPDRTPRVRPTRALPSALTDAEGRFTLDLEPADTAVVVESPGRVRDIVPLADLGRDVVLPPAPAYRKEKVVVIRLRWPGEAPLRTDDELRALLFSREPGAASAANYFYEISKGSLELELGRFLPMDDETPPHPRDDVQARAILARAVTRLRDLEPGPWDAVDNRTGAPGPDGRPDHLWVVAPGRPGTVTDTVEELSAICILEPLPWNRTVQWPMVLFPDETPLGFIVHEALHAMGENRVDDFYVADRRVRTAGRWDVMDAGMFQGWDAFHPGEGPWQEDTAYSPAHPMGWVRTDLWYHGAFKDTVPTLRVERAWEGWLDPLARAPGAHPQRLVVPDPRRRGRFWEFNVRRPLGFDRGRVAGRWGAGYEGLVVARVDPGLLSRGEPRGPVRVIDAHPGTPEPARPRYPGGRWQLDDAAFNLGPGERSRGQDGPLAWEVLAVDPAGRMRIRVRLKR
ncbi:carboxypeptidase-like regulatory domain-containing protein [Mesoterricola sediminis]|uniref:Uncharacterized protein n=1 Tax=Mesoterricola sediminis TaxID=2927980 RepID=A0AA48GX34_9BACT|nr:carboxypeptidase-like regulatory domain-containing protein [Mesoterricola sediminis]BDU77864.1 hypothetical protein METESE_28220 [Mesoterricola sediminis]